MPKVDVSLNTAATPPVTLKPLKCEVTLRNDTIRWKEAASSPNKGFSFVLPSCASLPDPPFNSLSVTPTEISVDDDNTGPNEYPYTIVVSYNGRQYSSAGAEIGGNPGDPTVRNK